MRQQSLMGKPVVVILLTALGVGSLMLGCSGGIGGEGSGGPVPVPKGSRMIGFDVRAAQDGDYDAAMDLAQTAGMEVVGIFLQWDMLETSPGVYDPTLLTIIDSYYPARGVSLDLTLAVINANVKVLPTDLMGRSFDDPVMIDRFRLLLDFVLDRITNVNLHALNIGSEMDVYFGTDTIAWNQFKTFYDAAITHVKARDASIVITVEPTFEGLMGAARDQVIALNENSDAIGVSYYPFVASGDVADPTVVQTDFDAITSAYTSRSIFFFQYGYPTGSLLNSSEARQAEFINETFKAWDRHASRIGLIDFTWLHDTDPAEVAAVAVFYGLEGDAKFADFIGTLGLRTWAGLDKPAFVALQTEAAARGW